LSRLGIPAEGSRPRPEEAANETLIVDAPVIRDEMVVDPGSDPDRRRDDVRVSVAREFRHDLESLRPGYLLAVGEPRELGEDSDALRQRELRRASGQELAQEISFVEDRVIPALPRVAQDPGWTGSRVGERPGRLRSRKKLAGPLRPADSAIANTDRNRPERRGPGRG